MFDHPKWRARPLATAYRLLTCNVRQRLGPLNQAVIAYDEGRSRLQVDVRTASGVGLYRFGHPDRDIQLIRALLSPGDLFVDGGAHIGLITLVGAAKVGRTGKVIAFEPASLTRQALLKNLELSGFGWVEVRSEALADTSGERTFTGFTVDAWGSSSFVPPDGLPGRRVEETVRTITLDEVVPVSDYGRLRVIKLDLEGAEYAALQGARHLLETVRMDLIIELEPDHLCRQGASVAAVETLLREYGYQFYRVAERDDGVFLEPAGDLDRGGERPNVYATVDLERARRAGVKVSV
jgi:FkbM family methyltransferase